MADIIDIANDLIDSEVARALNKIRQEADLDATGPALCIDCGDNIPKERQELGLKRCVACASEFERRKALYANGE
jgi:RNA polymerase-binding transcription factor DksA